MAVNLPHPEAATPVGGVLLASTPAGVKYEGRDDLVLITVPAGSRAAAVFTRSSFQAAPVLVARRHLGESSPRALVINSGNANAATGVAGEQDALDCCRAVADAVGCQRNEVLPFSTGVIGERLPVQRMVDAIPQLTAGLAQDRWLDAARGIMTTDTVPKLVSRTVEIDGRAVTVTGIAKGSGMIKPDMATMLAYVMTDAEIAQPMLDGLVSELADESFNCVTVDGDTSTNDAFVLVATGQSGVRIAADGAAMQTLRPVIAEVCVQLAQALIRDGEGATKFVTVTVTGGRDVAECRQCAYTIAESPLVKTAMFAGDANWGRFCMAIGRAGIDALDTNGVALHLDDVQVARGGMIAPEYTEEAGAAVMAQDEFTVRVELERGTASATIWTTDFSYDYVKINAEYRT